MTEDRVAMQSLIAYTRSLEQNNANVQSDIGSKRDFQQQRLENLKYQIDDLQSSKENLESILKVNISLGIFGWFILFM